MQQRHQHFFFERPVLYLIVRTQQPPRKVQQPHQHFFFERPVFYLIVRTQQPPRTMQQQHQHFFLERLVYLIVRTQQHQEQCSSNANGTRAPCVSWPPRFCPPCWGGCSRPKRSGVSSCATPSLGLAWEVIPLQKRNLTKNINRK